MTRAAAGFVTCAILLACAQVKSKERIVSDTHFSIRREGAVWALSLSLRNPGPAKASISWFEPFIELGLEVHTDGGARLQVLEPALDIPVQRRTHELAPGETIEIATPVQLRFGARGSKENPFTWTIVGEPQPVNVSVHLDIEGLGKRTATARLDP